MLKTSQISLSFFLFSMVLGGCSTSPSSDSECINTLLVSSLARAPLSPADDEDTRSISISKFKSGCGGSSADLPGGSGDIGIYMTLTMPESRNESEKTHKVSVPIFVALVNNEDKVLDRKDEKIMVSIGSHYLNQGHKITYRPPAGININSRAHRILVGINGNIVPIHIESSHPKITKKVIHKKGEEAVSSAREKVS